MVLFRDATQNEAGNAEIYRGGFWCRIRDADMTIKIIFERSSQKGGSAGGSKRGLTGDPP